MTVDPLPATLLYTSCDLSDLPFTTTEELEDLNEESVGQERAVAAVRFGIRIRPEGFNLYCLGSKGTGKSSVIRQCLRKAAAERPVADDWCYVHNFNDDQRPQALRLPPGRARAFCQGMHHLVEELQLAIPALFESDEFLARKQAIDESLKKQHERMFTAFRENAERAGLSLLRTSAGLILAPLKEDNESAQGNCNLLSEDEQEHNVARLQTELETLQCQLPHWEREKRQAIQNLVHELAHSTVDPLINRLKEVYADVPAVASYLDDVHQNIIANIGDFLVPREGKARDHDDAFPFSSGSRPTAIAALRRFQVKVLVFREGDNGAPVVFVDHPTKSNLIGRIEYLQQCGTVVTDLSLIKEGALHRANGGYLVLQARKILAQPFAWENLKRALRAREIKIENSEYECGFFLKTLSPEPIPLSIKVVLLGEPLIYYFLSHHDPDFRELFKVAADFDDSTERTPETVLAYARLLAALVRRENLRPLHRDAVARLIEHAARLAEDSTKLSTHMASITDLAREADYWAGQSGADLVSGKHVQQAVDAQIDRQNRIHVNVREEILHNTVLVDTTGAVVGQINALSVFELGSLTFGAPSRITCRVRMGKGEVVDIEREVELGGPLHSKGVLIFVSFLAARFAVDMPLSLSATLVFEQSYGGVEGDSASSTELYALLSALADVPIRQDLAVTGSVNQLGQIQAIGSVNEKIEGFFHICQARGLTGGQGVLIPRANVRNLMLRAEVREAAEAGLFHIYPITNVDEGIALLTGWPSGKRDESGTYPLGSINRKVAARLKDFAARSHRLSEAYSGSYRRS